MNLEAKPPEPPDNEKEIAFNSLTPHQKKVMQMTAAGLPVKEIAKTLGVAAKTIDVHKDNLMRALQINNTSDITRIWLKFGKDPDHTNEENTLP